MAFRVTSQGVGTYHSQYDYLYQAEAHYNAAVENSGWDSVTLSMWVEGAGYWHTIRTATPNGDWHNSPRTHSYA